MAARATVDNDPMAVIKTVPRVDGSDSEAVVVVVSSDCFDRFITQGTFLILLFLCRTNPVPIGMKYDEICENWTRNAVAHSRRRRVDKDGAVMMKGVFWGHYFQNEESRKLQHILLGYKILISSYFLLGVLFDTGF